MTSEKDLRMERVMERETRRWAILQRNHDAWALLDEMITDNSDDDDSSAIVLSDSEEDQTETDDEEGGWYSEDPDDTEDAAISLRLGAELIGAGGGGGRKGRGGKKRTTSRRKKTSKGKSKSGSKTKSKKPAAGGFQAAKPSGAGRKPSGGQKIGGSRQKQQRKTAKAASSSKTGGKSSKSSKSSKSAKGDKTSKSSKTSKSDKSSKSSKTAKSDKASKSSKTAKEDATSKTDKTSKKDKTGKKDDKTAKKDDKATKEDKTAKKDVKAKKDDKATKKDESKKPKKDKEDEPPAGGGGDDEDSKKKSKEKKDKPDLPGLPSMAAKSSEPGGDVGGGSGGAAGDFGFGAGTPTTVNVYSTPALGSNQVLQDNRGLGYAGVEGLPADAVRQINDQETARQRLNRGLDSAVEGVERRSAILQASNRQYEAQDDARRTLIEEQRNAAEEKELRNFQVQVAESEAREAPTKELEKIRTLAQVENNNIQPGTMVTSLPSVEEDLADIAKEEADGEKMDQTVLNQNAKVMEEGAKLYDTKLIRDPSGNLWFSPSPGPEQKAISDARAQRAATASDTKRFLKKNPREAADIYESLMRNPQFSNALRSINARAPSEPVAASSIGNNVAEQQDSEFEVPRPPKITGQDRTVRDIMQFFASACNQFVSNIASMGVEKMSWEQVFLLILKDYIEIPGARTMTETVPVQLWANRYYQCKKCKSTSYLLFQVMTLFALDLVTVNILRRSSSSQLSVVYAEQMEELLQKHKECLALLFSFEGETKKAWFDIVDAFAFGKNPLPQLISVAFDSFGKGAYQPVNNSARSAYAAYSRSMVDVMRAVQDLVEKISSSAKGGDVAFQQFLTCQSWLVPTSYVGRCGLTGGVKFATLLRDWMLGVRMLFSQKREETYIKTSQDMKEWLECTYPSAARLWNDYTVFLKKKQGYHTSYLDNLPAIGLIIDETIASSHHVVGLHQVLLHSNINVVPTMQLSESRTPEEFDRQIGLLLANTPSFVGEALESSDLPFFDDEPKDGDLVDQYLYYKASGKEDEAQRVQAEIFTRSSDLDAFESSLSEQNRTNFSSTLANYQGEASKRVGNVVAQFKSHFSYVKFNLGELSLSLVVALRAVMGDAWKCGGVACSKEEQDFLWSHHTHLQPQVADKIENQIIGKLASVYKDDPVAYQDTVRFVLTKKGLMSGMAFLAQWAYRHPVAKQVLFKVEKNADSTTIKDLVAQIIQISASNQEFWNALRDSAKQSLEELSEKRKIELLAKAEFDYASMDGAIYSMLLIELLRSDGEIYDQSGVLYYSGKVTLRSAIDTPTSFCFKTVEKIRAVYGSNSVRYRFADHLRLARYYQDRASFVASADRANDLQRAQHNLSFLEAIVSSANNESEADLYRQLIHAVLEERPYPISSFFVKLFHSSVNQSPPLTAEDQNLLALLSAYDYI